MYTYWERQIQCRMKNISTHHCSPLHGEDSGAEQCSAELRGGNTRLFPSMSSYMCY